MAIQGDTKGAKERAAARRIEALELRKSGASYRQIGRALNISGAQAHRDVCLALAGLARIEKHTAEELQAIEVERLDLALLAIAPQVKAGHLGAIDRWIRLSERRCKLLGLDARTSTALLNIDLSQLSDEQVE